MVTYSRRDLSIIEISDTQALVVACDSCGGIGEKPGDLLKAPAKTVGSYTARVALMEVLSTGAAVVSIFNSVCCEMSPTGQSIIFGIEEELYKAKISNAILGGSTEENMKTGMTAMGLTVIGIADKSKLKFNPCKAGDLIIVSGRPMVGNEVLEDDGNNLADYNDIYMLLENPDVREIVPVGSKGICYEANLLAKLNGLYFSPISSNVDINKSAGPGTCLIAAVPPGCQPNITGFTIIGTLLRG